MTVISVTLDVPTRTTQIYGDGHDWEIDAGNGEDGGIGGLFDLTAKMFDTTRNLGSGDVTSPHYSGAQLLSLPLVLADAATPSAALDLVEELQTAWAPIEGTADADLATLVIEIWGHTYAFVGKPVGRKVKTGLLRSSGASALCTFKVYGEAPGS